MASVPTNTQLEGSHVQDEERSQADSAPQTSIEGPGYEPDPHLQYGVRPKYMTFIHL